MVRILCWGVGKRGIDGEDRLTDLTDQWDCPGDRAIIGHLWREGERYVFNRV